MTFEQPVVLAQSKHEQWAEMAAQMMNKLREYVPESHLEHIGSTAVPDLPAKDVVDLLVGIQADKVLETARQLADLGFDLEGERERHCWLSYPARTARNYVIHVVEYESESWNERIAFRDLLRQDLEARIKYLEVKKAAAQDTHNWDGYGNSKTSVVMELLADNDSQ